MTDQTITLSLAEALEGLASPDQTHRMALSFLPDLHGASRSVRADLGVLYRLALPTELGGRPGCLVIRYRSPIPVPGAEPVEAPSAYAVGQRLTVRVVAEKRREDEIGRTRVRAVRDDEAESWALALLARHGLDVDGLTVSQRWSVGPRPGRSFTLRDVTARITAITDPASFTAGIGRGKSFGYGLPLIL